MGGCLQFFEAPQAAVLATLFLCLHAAGRVGQNIKDPDGKKLRRCVTPSPSPVQCSGAQWGVAQVAAVSDAHSKT